MVSIFYSFTCVSTGISRSDISGETGIEEVGSFWAMDKNGCNKEKEEMWQMQKILL